jgi:gentisate 1,2-dioxygenase
MNPAEAAAIDRITHIDDLVASIARSHCTPGWIPRKVPLMWPKRPSVFMPTHWRYAELKPALQAAGRLIGTDQAERRNFVLRSPIPGNDFATTRTLVGAYQSILPGERARSHRHSSHALRVILEAQGSYSVVNGKRHPMESGDIVLTPGGHWHGHGHDGDAQAYWFDCLDLPLVQLLEPMNVEEFPGGWEPDVQSVEVSPMRIRWQDICLGLEHARSDALLGPTLDCTSALMPTITILVRRWERGWSHAPYRHRANEIHVVLQGSGRSEIGDECFDWAFGDVFTAPMGVRIRHEATDRSVVVTLSDEALLRHCQLYEREAL